jgi:hypothetical protein
VTTPIEIRRRTPAEMINHTTRRIAELLNHPDAAFFTTAQRVTLLSVAVSLDIVAADLTEQGT